MSGGRRRAWVKRTVARGLRRAAHHLDDGEAEPVDSDGDAADLEPEDVGFDAFAILDRMAVGVEVRVVDTRDVQADGHVPESMHRPLAALRDAPSSIPREETVMLLDDDDARAIEGALILRRAGHDDAWAVLGGTASWRREGGAWQRA